MDVSVCAIQTVSRFDLVRGSLSVWRALEAGGCHVMPQAARQDHDILGRLLVSRPNSVSSSLCT